jgi:regulator of sigma E protease
MTFISAIILLGILIFVHELGHFIFAKLMGVKVLKFSLGFGRKLIGRKIGETEYQIAAFPLGGYVKMFGEESGEEARITGEKEEAEPPSQEDLKRTFRVQPVWKRILIVLAGPVFNILFTYVIFVGFLVADMPVVIPNLQDISPEIGQVVEGTPAERAGLKPGDIFIEADEKPVGTWFDLVALVSKKPGEEVLFKVKRGDKTFTIGITPEAVTEKDPQGEEITFGRIGIIKAGGNPFFAIEADGPLSALWGAAEATWKLSVLVIDVLGRLVTGTLSVKTVGGPITIVHESGKAAALGITPYLFFMAFISTNLGIINLFPIPILDGGHIVFLSYEAVARKPANEKVVAFAQRMGLAFLLMLIVLVTYNDILRVKDDVLNFFRSLFG